MHQIRPARESDAAELGRVQLAAWLAACPNPAAGERELWKGRLPNVRMRRAADGAVPADAGGGAL